MKLHKKAVTTHEGKIVTILSPIVKNHNLIAGHDKKGFEVIFGDNLDFHFLMQSFSVAGQLKQGEVIYISFEESSLKSCDLSNNFEFYKGIYLVNYCVTQLSMPYIHKLNSKNVLIRDTIKISVNAREDETPFWKVKNRLTVRKYGEDLFIYGNRDVFSELSNGAYELSQCECNDTSSGYTPHYHYDWYENTSKSIGVCLHYWHNKKLEE